MEDKYKQIVDKHTPKEDRLKNAIITFIAGGLFGVLAELLLRGYMVWFNLPRKESGVVVTLTLVIVASILARSFHYEHYGHRLYELTSTMEN